MAYLGTYLEEVDPKVSAEENIKNLCFVKGALLLNEFNHIFSNSFIRNSHVYQQLAEQMASGTKTFKQLTESMHQQ